ncbi:DUF1990 family protein [Microbacterium enclense]|uniref:DUF1990 family protein n=1 Tax=Microbacterium enclense TaxID=993073 RepID=UPI0036DCE7CF
MSDLTYSEVGATAGDLPSGYHHVRRARTIGRGRVVFEQAADALFHGAVQRRAGAEITLSQTPLRVGTRVDMRLRLGPLRFTAPCMVVWAERTDHHAGFAYGTLPGHPERGEERFELTLHENGDVTFLIVAFSAPGRWFTRIGAPVGRLVQAWATRRYLETLP